ncbi:MAG: Asp-tRNA(Asn)/Glu-tRNA(Gln) amidotransferase subunit GatA [bacterium]|nr:Asp-tRNA(Asn)/Glu-tRNA(Gln) amidotransferase subunit GatA [bacterium]
MNIATATISELKEAMETGEMTSVDIVKAYLARCDELNGALNAFVEIYKDEAMAQARIWDKARSNGDELPVLAGIPIGVKDNILVKGHIASAGAGILKHYTAAYNATVIERLQKAGAIILGRTNMDDAAMGSSTETSIYGPTKNPWNTNKIPGGTSGGSAAAVMAGLVPAALGSDTGGSIRQPASLCGVLGMKPTYGRVSRFGLIANASSLDQIGVLTRTTKDASLLLEVMSGHDKHDATSADEEVTIPELIDPEIKGLKIGIPKEYFLDEMDPDVRARVEEARDVLVQGGAEVVEISLPHTEYALAAYYVIQPCEASSNLARFDGIRYGKPEPSENLEDRYVKTRAAQFGSEVKRRIMLGTYALSSGYYDAYYKKALQVRAKVREDFENAFKEVDVILTPTSPGVAWDIGEKFEDPIAMYLADIYTISLNLAGLPGVSLPCGFIDGLPVGFQLIAPAFDEYTLFRMGNYYQSKTDWHKKTPEL